MRSIVQLGYFVCMDEEEKTQQLPSDISPYPTVVLGMMSIGLMVQNDSEMPESAENLASDYADHALLMCMNRFNNFLDNSFEMGLNDVGISGLR